MKASTLLVALSLAVGGSAFAQTYDSRDAPRDKPPANVKSHPVETPEAKEGLGTKMKRALKRAGDKTRQAFNRNERDHGVRDSQQAVRPGADNDTRRMGGPAAERAHDRAQDRANDRVNDPDRDHDRRGRMDDAYNNWRNKQKQ